MPVKIFVGNLQVESNRETEDALRSLFEQFGTVVECDILTGKNFGFVHMESDSEANLAIAALHGEEFFGGQINVEKSDNQSKGKRPPRSGGMGGGRGGSRGGRGGSRGGDRAFGRNDSRPRGRGGMGDRRSGGRFDPYSRNGAGADRIRDPYARDPYSLPPRPRDPYARDLYAREAYAREMFDRDPYYGRDPYDMDPYGRLAGGDPYGRPPPEYYDRAGLPSRDPYYERLLAASGVGGAGLDRELVSYPVPRSSAFGKNQA